MNSNYLNLKNIKSSRADEYCLLKLQVLALNVSNLPELSPLSVCLVYPQFYKIPNRTLFQKKVGITMTQRNTPGMFPMSELVLRVTRRN